MNLIKDTWIPVLRKNGESDYIKPSQVIEPDIVSLHSPRPDFNGALIQFLIGILQTAYPPKTERYWKKLYDNPPGSKELDAALQPIEYAFELFGEGPRFMQDMTIKDVQSDKNTKRIAELLIDYPGDNTLKENKDHFVKRDTELSLCSRCTALGLFTLQINAPSGGAGHRTSLRGGGPLTTLALSSDSSNLWKTIWLNILSEEEFNNFYEDTDKIIDEIKFPWLTDNYIAKSDKGPVTTPVQIHPVHLFWSMPRRIWLLDNDEKIKQGICSLCHEKNTQLLTHYVTINYGINYEGDFFHPLSPYYYKKDKNTEGWFPEHPHQGGIQYQNWLDIAYINSENKRPAEIVNKIYSRSKVPVPGIWAFGYDMDNAKARCWYETRLPAYHLDDSIRKEFIDYVSKITESSSWASGALLKQVKEAWFKRPKDAKGDISFIKQLFYSRTENDFYKLLPEIILCLRNNDELKVIKENWHSVIAREAMKIFDEYVMSSLFEEEDPKRIVEAKNNLKKSLYSIKIKQLLEII